MGQQVDFCILGAGLAGCCLADALHEQDFSTAVIDRSGIAAGASGTPGGLVNPATGRRATKSWKAEQCYEAVAATLEKVQAESRACFYQNNGLLRPALLEKMARKMKEQYRTTTWPDEWCHWKSEGEIKEMHPGIHCVDGGLWLPIGLSVDLGGFLQAYVQYLTGRGLPFFLNRQPTIAKDRNAWQLEAEGLAVKARNLVYATGRATADSSYWSSAPLRLIKGQVATFRSEDGALPFSHSISSLGYMARTGSKHTLVQGSTYEHDFDHFEPDAGGAAYLRKRLRRTLPDLARQLRLSGQWAGVRVSTPDRKPVLGHHPRHDNLHVFTGLGSKGLLYGPFLARHYGEHLKNGTRLYPEIALDRFL